MRTLKFHEKKLLKKTNFFNWRPESDREIAVVRRYHINSREDYIKYNKLCGYITKLVACLAKLDSKDQFRIELTELVLSKLFDMGLINQKKSLKSCDKLSVSKFCRRRLPVVMVRLRLAKSVKEATEYIEQGHIRIGPSVVTDPAFHVTRNAEDFVTWTKDSAIHRKVLKYNDKLDDYDLLE